MATATILQVVRNKSSESIIHEHDVGFDQSKGYTKNIFRDEVTL